MKHILIVVDMQTDFVDGALGTPEAVAILDNVTAKIKAYAHDPDGVIFVTYDTHAEDYMETSEGKHLPVPHCIKGTAGWALHPAVAAALEGVAYTPVEKPTFPTPLWRSPPSARWPCLLSSRKPPTVRTSTWSSSAFAPTSAWCPTPCC